MASAIFSTFYLLSAFVVAVPGFLFIYGSQLPQFLQDCLLYGKARGRTRTWTIVQLMEIPKRYVEMFNVELSVSHYLYDCIYLDRRKCSHFLANYN